MASTFDAALGQHIAAARASSQFPLRRTLVEQLCAADGSFAPAYTIMQRIEDGTRPLRVGEFVAIVDLLGIPADSLIPSDLDVAERVRGRGRGTAQRKYEAELEDAVLQISVEQLVGLAHVLDLPFDELYAKIADTAAKAGVVRSRAQVTTP